jgi:predicted lipoprotein with Yx(FWY)xxD motif
MLGRNMTRYAATIGGLLLVAAITAACGSSVSTPAGANPTTAGGGVAAGAGNGDYGYPAPATQAAAGVTQAVPAGSATVEFKAIGSQTVMIAGSNGMTVYTFTKDAAGSGVSTCTGGCHVKWPALTIPAGTTPTAGAGVGGQLGTITRSDDGTLQVTYNGLPLYFFQGDKAPGDTNGSYTNWNLVKP